MKREKLTLRLERDLIEKAKRVAKERETSVSGMVAGFFDNLESPPSRGRRQRPDHLPFTRLAQARGW
jgi:hypothetical protein